MHNTLQLVLILLAAAVLMVVVFRVLRLPPLLGYLLVGMAIGPHALGWIPDAAETRHLAEFGVVFLMFSIGLEFSLPRLVTMRRIVFGLGSAQVGLTMLIVLAAALAMGLDWRDGVIFGGALAMSSTAIVSKMLAERGELHTPHGRHVIGVLLFQDLAVVPLLIIFPALAMPAASLPPTVAAALAKAALILALLLFFGQRLMRPWFHLVAKQKSSELFMLNVLLITLGLAYVTELAGLSLALGAFLAGMLISETEYRYQVEDDIKPFRDVLMGLFFVTVGMLLDLHAVFANLGWVALLLGALLLLKLLLTAGLSRLFENGGGAALRTGLYLAQAGEFGFVLLAQASAPGGGAALQIVLAAMLLSMLAAPFMIEHSGWLVRLFYEAEWLNSALALHDIAVKAMSAERHVIICGYGRSGQHLARFLDQEEIRFIALDLDPQRVKAAAAAGENVVYGEAARREVLIAAGLLRARALAVTFADVAAALKILAVVRELRPDLPVVVRTVDDSELDSLKQAGATEVVPEVLEGSLMLASHALMLLGVPFNRVLKRIRETREQRYSLFQGFFSGVSDEIAEDGDKSLLRLHSVVIGENAAAAGKTLHEMKLDSLRVEVTMVRRRNIRGAPLPETRLEAGDVVVLRGAPANLEAAEIRLLRG